RHILAPILGRAPRRCALLAHELGSKREFCRVLIVRSAAQPDACLGRLAATRHFVDVIELEKGARRAAAPGFAHEGALAAIALPDSAFDVSRNVARVSARTIAR